MTDPQKINPEEIEGIRFTDPEAIRLIAAEARRTDEPLARVATRCIIRYFAMRQVPAPPHDPASAHDAQEAEADREDVGETPAQRFARDQFVSDLRSRRGRRN